MANAIAQETRINITGIFERYNLVLLTIGNRLSMGDYQEWPDDIALAWQHTNQTSQTTST